MIWRGIGIAGLLVVFGTLGTWLGDRTPPTTVQEIVVMTPQVRLGGDLKIKYKVYRARSCHTLVERIIFDSRRQRYVLEDLTFASSPGPLGPDEYVSIIPIPPRAFNGEARYRAITTYKCNILHHLWPVVGGATADVTFDIVGEPDPNAPIEVVPRR
jgi:hypothetical protein